MKDLLKAATGHALAYLENLATRPVAPDAKAVAGLKAFDIPLQNDTTDPLSVINELDRLGRPATMAMPGPRFFGFVIGGSLPAALAANWIVSGERRLGFESSSHQKSRPHSWLNVVQRPPRYLRALRVTFHCRPGSGPLNVSVGPHTPSSTNF